MWRRQFLTVRFKNVKTAILLNKCHISGQLFRKVYCRIAKILECLILSLVNYHIGSQVCVLSVEANFFSSLSRYGCCLVNVWVVCKLFFKQMRLVLFITTVTSPLSFDRLTTTFVSFQFQCQNLVFASCSEVEYIVKVNQSLRWGKTASVSLLLGRSIG